MAMNDNLARNYNLNNTTYPLPKQKEVSNPKKNTKTNKKRFTFLEKAVMSGLSLGLFGLLIANITMAVQVSTTSREVQDVNRQISETEVINENLQQNVQELSRYDRVYEIGEKHGLELNEENIRNVQP